PLAQGAQPPVSRCEPWLTACIGPTKASRLCENKAHRRQARRVGNMAQIVLGLGTSHGPQLFLKPDQWHLRAQADRQNKQHWFRGTPYNYPELEALRKGDGFAAQITPSAMQAHFDRCQRAI